MRKTIFIKGVMQQAKKDKSGFFDLFDTSEGKIGVFEADVVSNLKANLDKWVDVEYVKRQNSDYYNITNFYEVTPKDKIPEQVTTPEPERVVGGNSEQCCEEVVQRIIHSIMDDRPCFKAEMGKADQRITVWGRNPAELVSNAKEASLGIRGLASELNQDG